MTGGSPRRSWAGRVVAGAIGVVGPADRLLDQGSWDQRVREVTATARAISRDLGAGRGGVVLSALS